MKILGRMAVVLLVAGGFAMAIAGLGTLIPPPSALVALAGREALRAAVAAQWFEGLSNAIFWPVLAFGVRSAERFWRRIWPAAPTMRFSGLPRGLGLLAVGLFTAVWVGNLYVVLVMASAPPHLASLARQLDAEGSVSLVVWILATAGAAVLSGKPAGEETERSVAAVDAVD